MPTSRDAGGMAAGDEDVVWVSAEDAMQKSAEVDWLIEGVLPAKSRAMLYGESGTGKTFVAVDVAASVAYGKRWHGRAVKPGLVYYIASENPEDVGPRLKAWESEHGGVAAWRETHIGPSPFQINRQGVDLASPDSVAGVIAWIKSDLRARGARTAALVVIDTLLASSDSGDITKPDDFKRMVSQINRIRMETGATVLVLHHPPDYGKGPMGGSAPKGGFPVRYKLTRQRDGKDFGEDGDFQTGDTITLTCQKMTTDAKPKPLQVQVKIARPERGVKLPTIANKKAVIAHEKAKGKDAKATPREDFDAVWAEGVRDNSELARRTGLNPNTIRSRKRRKLADATDATLCNAA